MFLTRPPRSTSEEAPVRLACIRHAASVVPEPGSNSPSSSPLRGFYLVMQLKWHRLTLPRTRPRIAGVCVRCTNYASVVKVLAAKQNPPGRRVATLPRAFACRLRDACSFRSRVARLAGRYPPSRALTVYSLTASLSRSGPLRSRGPGDCFQPVGRSQRGGILPISSRGVKGNFRIFLELAASCAIVAPCIPSHHAGCGALLHADSQQSPPLDNGGVDDPCEASLFAWRRCA